MLDPRNDYISVTYNKQTHPYTEYPDLLAKYLVSRYELRSNQRLLEVGCGRGEFLRGFIRQGLEGYGTDQSDVARNLCPDAKIKLANLEDRIPFEDNFFDVIYSKSVIEHFYKPEKLVEEIYRTLKPSGRVITLTPDWTHVYKSFYEDYTHRTPFTQASLRDIMLIHSFEEVEVGEFLQLPIVWKFPWMKYLSKIIACVTPQVTVKKFKFVRFSKEVMLLSSAIKPE